MNSTTIPHASVVGIGNGTFDYFTFTVSVADLIGFFDIDGENFNTELFLYDFGGNLLASNDDALLADIGDGGSGGGSFVSHGPSPPAFLS